MKEYDIHVHSIKILSNFNGQRIDNFLRVYLRKIPKSMIYKIIRTGAVRVNKSRIKFQYRLKTGDYVRVPIIIKKIKINTLNMQHVLEKINFLKNVIIYEDDYLLGLNKPSGVAVHGGSGLSFGLIEGLRILYPNIRFLELVHRLDRATSGVLLVAKKRTSLLYLHEQLRLQQMKKKYLALVYGFWDANMKTISTPILKKSVAFNIYDTRIISKNVKKEKLAITHFYVKERFGDVATLLIVTPVTGKTHQIRLHTQCVNHPIIGDDIYGNYACNIKFKKYGLDRLFLHAYTLSFYHPNTQKIFHMTASIDSLLIRCLSLLRKAVVTDFNHVHIIKKENTIENFRYKK